MNPNTSAEEEPSCAAKTLLACSTAVLLFAYEFLKQQGSQYCEKKG